MSRIEDASTMLRTMKRLMALSLGMALPVDAQRTRLTWPRPFLLRPWLRRLTVILALLCDLCAASGEACWRRVLTVVCVVVSARLASSCDRRWRRLARSSRRGLARARAGRSRRWWRLAGC